MSYSQAQLGRVAKLIRGIAFKPEERVPVGSLGSIVCLRTANIQDVLRDTDLIAVPRDKVSRDEQRVRQGDILVSSANSWNLVGKCAAVPCLDYDAAAGAFISILRPQRSVVDARYLYRWLSDDQTQHRVRQCARQTTNIANLSAERFLSLRLPLPPLAEQQRIAAILDKADAVRRKRREILRLLDEFLRSAFLEMFGDPVRNEKGWDRKRLRDIAVVTTGNTPPRSHSEYYGDTIEWIKSDNINTPGHYVTRAKEGLSLRGRQLGRTVGAGAILMTCIAGTKDCIGNVAVTDREVAFNQQINAVEPRRDVDHRFVYVQFLVGKGLVQRASTDSMKGMVSKSRLEDVQVLNPPSHMQQKFGEWFTRWHTVYSKQCQAADTAEALFDSLSQRAFQGEL